jgi:hypothetical protein
VHLEAGLERASSPLENVGVFGGELVAPLAMGLRRVATATDVVAQRNWLEVVGTDAAPMRARTAVSTLNDRLGVTEMVDGEPLRDGPAI